MNNVHMHSVTIFASFSLLMSLMSCHSVIDHSKNVPKVLQQEAGMMFDSDLSGTKNSDESPLPVVPALMSKFRSPSEKNDFVHYQGYRNGENVESDLELPGPVISYNEEAIKLTDKKRGRHNSNRQSHLKRSSLSDLIKRLMALKGNSFPDGRITLMRFGTGRRK